MIPENKKMPKYTLLNFILQLLNHATHIERDFLKYMPELIMSEVNERTIERMKEIAAESKE